MKFLIKRSTIIGALILFQVAFLFSAVYSLNIRVAYLYGVFEAVSIIVVLMLIYNRDNPYYKMTWIFIIMVFPIFGILLYILTGTHYLSPNMRKKLKESYRFNKSLRYQDPDILDELKHKSETALRQSQYIFNTANRPVYKGTSTKLLTPGETMFAALIEELQKAQSFIFLEFFIIAEGHMWNEVYEILKRKAQKGVEVRVIYDDVGSIDHLSKNFSKKLLKDGIKISVFNPFLPVLNKVINYRDHRKIVVIDGNVGFTGGINIGDEYINEIKLHGYWKDTSIMLKGDAVWSMTLMFLDMWMFITDEKLQYDRYRPFQNVNDDGYVQPFEDSPVNHYNLAECAYMQIINAAKKYVYIITPYLIIDNEMMTALCMAAQSGIDVRIITPYIYDKWYVHRVTRSNYQELMESGVKIYEYLPGFIHSKIFVSDDEYGVVGSVNMDYRSFYLQFECAVWMHGSAAVRELKEDYIKTIKVSRQIDLERWKKRSVFNRLFEFLLRIFSPLM